MIPCQNILRILEHRLTILNSGQLVLIYPFHKIVYGYKYFTQKKGVSQPPPNNFNVSDSLIVDTTTITECTVRFF